MKKLIDKNVNLSRRSFLLKSSSFYVSMAYVFSSSKVLSFSIFEDKATIIDVYDPIHHIHGYIQDRFSKNLFVGNGTRLYSRSLGIFFSPDKIPSPESYELNPYAMALNDPINRIDPDGNLSTEAGVMIGVGVLALVVGLLTLGVGVATIGFGMGVAVGGFMIATGLTATTSASLQISAGSVFDTDPATSRNLIYASLGFDVASVILSLPQSYKSILSLRNMLKPNAIEIFTDTTPWYIHAHGALGLTGTSQGIKLGRSTARHFISQFQREGASVNGVRIVDFKSCFSGSGGIASQAQVMANELASSGMYPNLHHVIGYLGYTSKLHGKAVNLYPLTGRMAGLSHVTNSALGATFTPSVYGYGFVNSAIAMSNWRNIHI